MHKVTQKQINEFWWNWCDGPKILRFGQAFLNEFYPSIDDPDIFYEKDGPEAYYKAFDKYVEK